MIRLASAYPIDAVDPATASFLRKVVVFHQESDPPAGADRRREERHDFQGPVLVRNCEPDGGSPGLPIICEARDLSLRGMQFLASEPLTTGEHVLVAFALPREFGGDAVQFLAQVRHVEPGFDGEWHIGCEFLEALVESN